MTSSRSPWRQPESCSQLWIGNRIRSAVASPSPVSPARVRGRRRRGLPARPGGLEGGRRRSGSRRERRGRRGQRLSASRRCGGAARCPARAAGSTCSTGPSAEPRTRSSGRSTATRVTCSPLSRVDDEPTFSNSHPPAPQRSTACCRETNGTSVTRSLSGERPIRAVSPGPDREVLPLEGQPDLAAGPAPGGSRAARARSSTRPAPPARTDRAASPAAGATRPAAPASPAAC